MEGVKNGLKEGVADGHIKKCTKSQKHDRKID